MYIPKKYGASKKIDCVFCGKPATGFNKQKMPSCTNHKNDLLEDIRCNCGSYLEIKEGKFGTFFLCMNCGPININKALQMIETTPKIKKESKKKDVKKNESNSSFKKNTKKDITTKKEITIDTNDMTYFS